MSRLLQALKNLEARSPKPAAGRGVLAQLADKFHAPSPDPSRAAPPVAQPARPSPIQPQPLDNPLAYLSSAVPTIVLRSPRREEALESAAQFAPVAVAVAQSQLSECHAPDSPTGDDNPAWPPAAELDEPPAIAPPSAVPQAAVAEPELPLPARQPTLLERSVLRTLADPERCEPFKQLAERFVRDLDQFAGRSVLVTGVGPASETHELLLHVAAVLAEAGQPILLIDGDAAHRTLTSQLDRSDCRGLADVVRGETTQSDLQALVQPTALDRLSLLPLGKARLTDLGESATRLAGVVQSLEETYRLVLIDGGRTSELAAATLARLCDATYFVIRLGETEAAHAQQALRDFRAAGARVLGCIATS